MSKWEKLFWKLGLDGCSMSELEEGVLFPEGCHDITDEICETELDAALNGYNKDSAEQKGYLHEKEDEENIRTTLADLAEANRQRALDQADEENLLLYQAATPRERRQLLAANVPDCLSSTGAKRFVREYILTYGLNASAERKIYLTALRVVLPDSKGLRKKGELVSLINKCIKKYV